MGLPRTAAFIVVRLPAARALEAGGGELRRLADRRRDEVQPGSAGRVQHGLDRRIPGVVDRGWRQADLLGVVVRPGRLRLRGVCEVDAVLAEPVEVDAAEAVR